MRYSRRAMRIRWWLIDTLRALGVSYGVLARLFSDGHRYSLILDNLGIRVDLEEHD